MDFTNYINSKDIKAYLRESGYVFNSLEAAWLIYQCQSISMQEKHDAWIALMNCMPDCDMPQRANCRGGSLFSYLKRYMEIENKMLESFYERNDNCIYFHGGEYVDEECQENECFDYIAYSNIESCISSLRELYGDYDYKYINVTKQYLNGGAEYNLRLNENGDIYSVSEKVEAEEQEILGYGLSGLFFDFPTPFKIGDILCNKFDTSRFGYDTRPFVFMGQSGRDSKGDKTRGFLTLNGDNTDMCGWGYHVDYNGRIYQDNRADYMNFEYFEGERGACDRILKQLSEYIKGSIGIDEYTNAVVAVRMDQFSDEAR